MHLTLERAQSDNIQPFQLRNCAKANDRLAQRGSKRHAEQARHLRALAAGLEQANDNAPVAVATGTPHATAA